MDTVNMLGEWPVILPDYRVEHCARQPNWEEGRLRSMHAHLKPGMVLYDVGSEHGDLSALYASWLRGCTDQACPCQDGDACHYVDLPDSPAMAAPEGWHRGGVVLIEGSELFWPVIRATFEANHLVPVGCWAGFAGDHDTPEDLRSPSWSTPSLTRGTEWPGWAGPSLDGEPPTHHGFKSVVESKDTIPNIRFDTLAEKVGPPDALTIDVEGAEALVLRGSERILREHRPLVWVSLHPQLLWFDYPEWEGMTAEDVKPWFVEFMLGYGYVAHFIEDNHESHYLCLPEESTADPLAGIEYLQP